MTRWFLPLSVFLSAAASLSVELAVVRLGAPYVGQSLLPWSIAIASVLLGLTAGHIAGGAVAGPASDIRQARTWLACAWIAAGLTALIMPVAINAIAGAATGDPGVPVLLVMAASAFPPSFAAGFIAPLVVRVADLMPGLRLSRMIGSIYAASAAGSVAGTAAAGFVLLETVGATGLIWIVASVWLVLGLWMMPWRQLPVRHACAGGAAVVAVLVVLVPITGSGPCFQESRYTCIRFMDHALADNGLVRFMILDEGVHSASDRDRPDRFHLGYAALTDRLAQAAFAASSPARALVIGGGGATLPRAWASAAPSSGRSPSVDVVSVEIDPAVVKAAHSHMWSGNLPRLTNVIADGRTMLRALPSQDQFQNQFNVILMDAYRTRSVPPHLVGREFDDLVARKLRPDGVFLSNIIDRSDNPSLTLSIARTVSEFFAAVDIWMTDESAAGITNFVVAAWKNGEAAYRPEQEEITATVMNAGEEPRSQTIVWRRFDLDMARKRWPDACAVQLTDDWAPVERLLAGHRVCRNGTARMKR